MDNVVALVFAKYPTPGAVKTRMVPPLWAEEAAALHHACLVAVYHKLAQVDRMTTRIVVTPDDRAADLNALVANTLDQSRLSSASLTKIVPPPAPLLNKEGLGEVLSSPKNPPRSPLGKGGSKQEKLGKGGSKQDNLPGTGTNSEPQALARADAPVSERGWQVENPDTSAESVVEQAWPQGDGDLGQRLQRASSRAFEGGADAVLFFGADSPTFPIQVLHDALDALTCHDVTIGPCDDGGYYLLGLSRPADAVFERIDWGGSGVAGQTLERARRAGLSIHELPPWYDLDRVADLEPAARDLAKLSDPAPQAMITLGRLIDEIRCRVG